jgi:acyl-CoA thioesterase FadM
MKLIKHSTLAASLCDATVGLSVAGAFGIVEDLVTEMMGQLHIDGVTCMREYGAMWVFVRNRIEMRKPLKWMDTYVAECCISSFTGVKLVIDTVLKKENEIAVASRLELCAVDLETGKIRRCDTVGVGENTPPEATEIDIKFCRDRFEAVKLLEEISVRSGDIDFCRHTNNISYVRYLINQFTVKELAQTPVTAVEIQYAGQTFEGDTLQIYSCGENRFTIMKNGTAAVNCIFCLKDRQD